MTSSPPEFILNISSLILLSPEEIRLAKRNTENNSSLVILFISFIIIELLLNYYLII